MTDEQKTAAAHTFARDAAASAVVGITLLFEAGLLVPVAGKDGALMKAYVQIVHCNLTCLLVAGGMDEEAALTEAAEIMREHQLGIAHLGANLALWVQENANPPDIDPGVAG